MSRKSKRKRKNPTSIQEFQSYIQEEIVHSTAGHKKKLRRKQGGMTGVAAGIAEYFDVDPTWVRLGIAAGTIFTSGAVAIAYGIMAFALPREGQNEHDDFYQIEYGDDWPMYSEDLPEATEVNRVCWNCDVVTKPNAKYCHSCGSKL